MPSPGRPITCFFHSVRAVPPAYRVSRESCTPDRNQPMAGTVA